MGDHVTLVFTKVVDQLQRGLVDEDEDAISAPTDRAYWEKDKGTSKTVALMDKLFDLVKEGLMTVVKPDAHDFSGACFPSGVLGFQDAVSRMPELQRRLIKLLSARQGRIPACVASSRF